MKNDKTIKCPICGNLSFGENDDYENCEVCGWENDPYQRRHPDETGANNQWTINNAGRIYTVEADGYGGMIVLYSRKI